VGLTRPAPGEVLHFSEDPTITLFAPHVAATAQQRDAFVWAVDAARAPDYWFPRQCPRALTWATSETTASDREAFLGASSRVHAIEYGWLEAMLVAAMGCYTFRLIRGPRAQDRVLCLDAIYVSAMLLVLTAGIRAGSPIYFEAALIIAVLGFASSVALAKFLMRGEVIE